MGFLGITILLIPLLPIVIIFLGVSSPEYVIYGTLNLSTSQSYSAWELYTSFLKHIVLLDFGTSTSSGQPVLGEVFSALGSSFTIIGIAVVLSYVFGTIAGLLSTRYSFFEKIWTKTEFIFYIPMIVFSYLVLYFLDRVGIDFLSDIRYLFAGLILSIYPFHIVSKSIYKTLYRLKESDLFVCHRSYGFSDGEIWRIFCKRYVAIDYLSFFENLIIFMFGFIFFVETPFGINGVGQKFVIAIQRFDYPVIIGFCVFSIILFSIIGIISEWVKVVIDPRAIND